jgi:putative transposase
VVFDPEDLGDVHVWGPDDAEPHLVQALDLTYARGMTLRQNALIRQILREEGANAEDRVALQRARNDIAQSVAELMTSRKQKARQRSAAIRGISSSKPDGVPAQAALVPDIKAKPKPEKAKVAAKVDELTEALPKILSAFQMTPPKRGRDGDR